MAHLFEIPELLCLICEQARRSDLARLLTTSRLFFGCAIPVVWRVLPESAPSILLGLLPNADTYPNINLSPTIAEALIQNLRPVGARSLTRFNLYAAHVRRITRSRTRQSNVAWDTLLKLVDARPILPNLEALRISLAMLDPYAHRISVQDSILSFKPYLSLSLVEIGNIHDNDRHCYMEPQTLTRLVSRIAQECPRLSSLKLSNATGCTAIERTNDLDELASSLGKLHSLRSLRLGLVVLDPEVLVALGALPNLESLSVNESFTHKPWPGSDEALKTPSAPLPDASFPALRHLGINLNYGFELVLHIWSITALVRRLTSVSMHVFGGVTCTQICDLVSAIRKSSPLVTGLYLDCAKSIRPIALLSSEVIDSLTQLPLQRLRLSGNDMSDSQGDGDRQLGLQFPSMKILQIRGQAFSFRDLACIAEHMPRLQQLSVPVKLDVNWPSRHELLSLNLTPSPSQIEFHFVSAGTTQRCSTVAGSEIPKEEVEAIAAGLHALWPRGVACAAYRNLHKDPKVSWASRVNAELERLRETDGLGNIQTEVMPRKHFSNWAWSWLERV